MPGSAPPTVAIDLRAAVRTHTGGVERHARELGHRLPALRPERYRLITPPSWLAHRAGHAWEQLVLPRRARADELILCPANLAPVLSSRTAVVIHDAAVLRHPDAYSAAYVAYQRRMLPALARRARLLLTVSEFSRGELAALLGIDPEAVAVAPGGVDSAFAAPALDRAALTARLGLERPYVLTVGTGSARKNLEVLEPCARRLAERGFELVLAGSDRGYLRGGQTRLRRLGYVPEPLLPALYAHAEVFVLPSRYEGRGLPCLEAMAAGTAVVAARAGALPETVGEAGRLVDPGDPDAWVQTVTEVLDDDGLRAELERAGRERAATQTWELTAELTDAAIGMVLTQQS